MITASVVDKSVIDGINRGDERALQFCIIIISPICVLVRWDIFLMQMQLRKL